MMSTRLKGRQLVARVIPSLENVSYLKNFEIFEQVIRYNLVWGSLRLINREAVYQKCNLYQTRLYKYNLFKNFKYSL